MDSTKCHFIQAFLLASTAAVVSASGNIPQQYPSLYLVEKTLLTTAEFDFKGHARGYHTATKWDEERLRVSQHGQQAPHVACARYDLGYNARLCLEAFISPEAVRPVSHSSVHGACFIVTASHGQAAEILEDSSEFNLVSFGPFPSALKIAPGLLEYNTVKGSSHGGPRDGSVRLTTTHGVLLRLGNVEGLNVELSPGTLPAHVADAGLFTSNLLEALMSESMNLHVNNVWSDPAMIGGEHLATPEGILRGREWSRAATVVHELALAGGITPGEICSWETVIAHHSASDVLLVSGTYIFSGVAACGPVFGFGCWKHLLRKRPLDNSGASTNGEESYAGVLVTESLNLLLSVS